jgi:regulator of protease activity HflC (stomatin/prohibitin superfamily)
MLTYPDSIDSLTSPRKRSRWWRYFGRHLPGLTVVMLLGSFVTVLLWPYVVINVPSGQVGVLWKRFNGVDIYCWCWVGRGTVLDPRELREEGLHIVWPWDKLYLYDLRLASTSQTYNAISKDGVNVTAQISVRYQLLHNSVAVLHKFIGPAYLATVLGPEIGSQARQVISQYTAQEVYTSRDAIQKLIRDNAQKSLGANLNQLVQPEAMEQPDPKHYNDFLQDAIQILDTLVLSIELPADIVAAINRQTEQYYMIQEYKFRVAREAEESKRKQIEADGIAAFQRTVSQGISESYLRWRGIEATLALAQSTNAKIVVIGTGRDGLPIILGNVDTPLAQGTPPPAGTGGTAPPSGTDVTPGPGDKTLPGPPSTTPGAPPPGGGSTGAPPRRGSSNSAPPSESDKSSTADLSGASGNQDKTANSSSPLGLSDVESIFSRISGALRPSGPDASSGTGAKPKQ